LIESAQQLTLLPGGAKLTSDIFSLPTVTSGHVTDNQISRTAWRNLLGFFFFGVSKRHYFNSKRHYKSQRTAPLTSAIGTYGSCCVSEACMHVTTVDTVITNITHNDRRSVSSASSRHGAKRRGGLYLQWPQNSASSNNSAAVI